MSFVRNDKSEAIVAGHQNVMFRIGVDLGSIVEEVALSITSRSQLAKTV